EPKTRVVRATQFGFYAVQAVMSCCASLASHSEAAEGECYVVDDDQQVFLLYLQRVGPVPNGLATQVHVRGRFDQVQVPALVPAFGLIGEALGRERGVEFVGQLVEYEETDVVARQFGFASDISQSCDKVFHDGRNSVKCKVYKGQKYRKYRTHAGTLHQTLPNTVISWVLLSFRHRPRAPPQVRPQWWRLPFSQPGALQRPQWERWAIRRIQFPHGLC